MNISHQYQNQLVQDRFGLQLSARLSEAAADLPYEISERLRAARVQALGQRKIAVTRSATSVSTSAGTATLTYGTDSPGWLGGISAAACLLALVLGLIAIHFIQTDIRATELAEIDTALLSDTLPPEAYADPGFMQFLKLRAVQNQ